MLRRLIRQVYMDAGILCEDLDVHTVGEYWYINEFIDGEIVSSTQLVTWRANESLYQIQ